MENWTNYFCVRDDMWNKWLKFWMCTLNMADPVNYTLFKSICFTVILLIIVSIFESLF